MDLYLLKNYSNYFNRKVKYRATLSEYIGELTEDEDYFILPNTNFNPNDGVSTSHIVGSANRPYTPSWQPDYCLVIEWPDGGQPRIVSRWFVTEFVRTMANQYSVALKRDTPCDKYDVLTTAPCYIEKAKLQLDDEMIVNNENMSFNQKKTDEFFLKDKSKCPWVVAYIPQSREEDEPVQVRMSVPNDVPNIRDNEYLSSLFPNISAEEIQEATRKELFVGQLAMGINYRLTGMTDDKAMSLTVDYGNPYDVSKIDSPVTTLLLGSGDWNSIYNTFSRWASRVRNNFNSFVDFIKDDYEEGITYNSRSNKVPVLPNNSIWMYNNRLFRLSIEVTDGQAKTVYKGNNSSDYLGILLSEVLESGLIVNPTYDRYKYKFVNGWVTTYKYVLTEISNYDDLSTKFNIPKNSRHVTEVPFDIVCFPYADKSIKNNGSISFTNLKEYALAAAKSIALKTSGTITWAYDVQILPFCPVPYMLDDDGFVDLSKGIQHVDYEYVKKTVSGTSSNKSIALFATNAFLNEIIIDKIYRGVISEESVNVADVCRISEDGRKVDNECDMWRLCSPNYSSTFEFKLSKLIPLSRNNITQFTADVTFRPYMPYIRVAPDFGFLYEKDYHDARGLICNGQFSITLVDDKWQGYELQNKNYQNMFNREIKNLEVNRTIQREQEQWDIANSWLGGIGSIGKGVVGGVLGGVGAGVGALVGGIGAGMNIASKYKQVDWNERAYQEQRSFKIDMFNMELDNIKALPASITQSSSININFKFFPVLEYYTCTDKERETLKSKLKYNGMTVGRIDFINNFLSTDEEVFIKGQLIRLDGLSEDSHLAQDLYEEVNKGLFFEPYIVLNKEEK